MQLRYWVPSRQCRFHLTLTPTPMLIDGLLAAWQAVCHAVRRHSLRLTGGLSAEDQALQAIPDASPTKWHLAHTTWFFETLLLLPHLPGDQPADAQWAALSNSDCESLGPRYPRPQRGLPSRPMCWPTACRRTQRWPASMPLPMPRPGAPQTRG